MINGVLDWEESLRKRNEKRIKHHQCYYTVGKLKELLKKFDRDDGLVLYQRIEDVYFKKFNWDKSTIIKHSSDFYPEEIYDEYIATWWAWKYDDESNLYLTAHY